MAAKFYHQRQMEYSDHPRFAGVRMAVLVTGREIESVSVCRSGLSPWWRNYAAE